jgi:hypothetical protein
MQNQEAIDRLTLMVGVVQDFRKAHPAPKPKAKGHSGSTSINSQYLHRSLDNKAADLVDDVELFLNHIKKYGPRLVRSDNITTLILVGRLVYVLQGYIAYFSVSKVPNDSNADSFFLGYYGRSVAADGVRFVNSMKTRFNYE